MPYTGFQGDWVNQKTGANMVIHVPFSHFLWLNVNSSLLLLVHIQIPILIFPKYVRKHNPLMSYDSCTMNPSCLARSKNFTLFYQDLYNDRLPQWMFITPNMTNDGHDSSVTTAGSFVRKFLEPLLANERFMKNTLILLSQSSILHFPVFTRTDVREQHLMKQSATTSPTESSPSSSVIQCQEALGEPRMKENMTIIVCSLPSKRTGILGIWG